MPNPNPLNTAIDALHSAFVGGPAGEAGSPVDFATDATEVEAPGISKPESLQEAAVESVAFYSEDRPARIAQVHLRLQTAHGLGKAHVKALLAETVKEGLLVLSGGSATLTDDGEALAVQRGWAEDSPEIPEHIREEQDAQEKEEQDATRLQEASRRSEDEEKREPLTDADADRLAKLPAKDLAAWARTHDSADDLRVLYRVEKEGKARRTVLAALVKRGKVLTGGKLPEVKTIQDSAKTDPRVTVQSNGDVVVLAEPADAKKALAAVPVVVPEEPEPAPTFKGIEVTPDLPDLSNLSTLEAFRFRLREIETKLDLIQAKLDAATAKPTPKKAPRSTRTPTGDEVAIGDLQPGTWIRLPAGKLALTASTPGVKWHAYFQQEEDGSWKKDSRLFTGFVTPAETPSTEVVQTLPTAAEKYLR